MVLCARACVFGSKFSLFLCRICKVEKIKYIFSPRNSMIFQVFFLSQDNNQSVEVLETEEIDFGEIIQRLQMGESIFIKRKNVKPYDSPNRIKE
jgi:hypothetical protein